MRFGFLELPGETARPPRPVVPVTIEDLEEAPQLCLIDTGASTNRFGRWLADAVGIDLEGASAEPIAVGG